METDPQPKIMGNVVPADWVRQQAHRTGGVFHPVAPVPENVVPPELRLDDKKEVVPEEVAVSEEESTPELRGIFSAFRRRIIERRNRTQEEPNP